MATTNYGLNHPMAVKLWSRKLFQEALKETWISRLTGEGSDSIIQIKTDTQKSSGDRVTVGLRMLLTGSGVQGDGTLEGNEEALTIYTDNLYIDQLRHAVRSAGKMSEQRVPFSVREEARQGLQDWWADRLDTWAMNQLASNVTQTDTRFTGNQACTTFTTLVLPSSSGATTTEGSLSATTTSAISLESLDQCVAHAKTATPMIRPARFEGQNYYVAILHPDSIYQLRQQTNSGQWADIQKASMQGGRLADNPLVTGAVGIYNNVIIHENTRLPLSTKGAGYRRGVFLGAQSAIMGFGGYTGGMNADWQEELFDYGNQLGVAGGMIAGLKKTQFNSNDFGVILLAGYAPSH